MTAYPLYQLAELSSVNHLGEDRIRILRIALLSRSI